MFRSVVMLIALIALDFRAFGFNALVAFGDSYTDTGNLPSSPPDYWNGRFSNGPLWVEYLCQSLGFSYNGANNFAVTGSESDGLGTQISYFPGTSDSANVLFAIWSGNNDFGSHLDIGYNDSAWNDRINGLVSSLTTAIDLLYQKGERNVVLFNQFDLTQTPRVRNNYTSAFRDYIRGKITTFNSRLASALPGVVSAHPGLQTFSVDIYSDMASLLAHYSEYGFTQTTIGALNDPNLSDKSFTGPGANYVFWDSEHPTSKAHSVIGGWAFATLPAASPAPTVTIGSPANNAQFTAPATMTIRADVVANGWTINQVPLLHDGILIGQTTSSPYSVTWAGVGAGSYNLTAQVNYGANQSVTSSPVTVSVNPAATLPLPQPWSHQDIGDVGQAGNASYDSNGTFTVSGSGDDIWDTSDSFQLAYHPFGRDGAIIARVTSQANTSGFAKAGLMFRETLDANSREVMQFITPSNGVGLQSRDSTGGTSTYTSGAQNSVPYWLKMERAGNTFNGYASADGVAWTLVGARTISMSSQVYAGLAVTAHNNSVLSTASFTGVQMMVSGPPPALRIVRLADGTVQLSINGQTGATFRSDASSDLSVWTPIATNVNTSGSVQVLDVGAKGVARRFYRVVSVP